MTDLTEFLRARIAETIADARHAQAQAVTDRDDQADPRRVELRLARFVLAECEAKRRIIDHHARRPDPEGEDAADLCAICSANGPQAQGWPCETLQLLALPYDDHPDYREEWRP